MIIVLKPEASKADADAILDRIEATGCKPLYMPGSERVVLGALGDERVLTALQLESDPMVESVTPILSPYKMVSREFHPHDTVVHIGDVPFGSKGFAVIAGPCSIESREQLQQTAETVQAAGAHCLRGGAYKPRSSPYSFQGLGREGLEILGAVSASLGIPTVTEVVDVADLDAIAEHADAFQIGARNMQNYTLLNAVGRTQKPTLLKRGPAATLDELLLAAEYVVSSGNPHVILCERGIKTFERATRNTLDLNAVPYLKQRSHLPVIVDPSHGTGIRGLVAPMAKAAVACGADGVMVEVHVDPTRALSDGHQSLFPSQFDELMRSLLPFVEAAGRTL
ncbi:MAG: 3-deoxy-7-phosphoheptulonate synthase [Gemmatimonadota bacterium]|nr:3-deoxy-7-phosphoheptulonate synthase [Gemmatimonadota bacterium]